MDVDIDKTNRKIKQASLLVLRQVYEAPRVANVVDADYPWVNDHQTEARTP